MQGLVLTIKSLFEEVLKSFIIMLLCYHLRFNNEKTKKEVQNF